MLQLQRKHRWRAGAAGWLAARAVVACAVIALVVIGGCASGGGSEEAGEAASPSQLMATLGSKELRHTRMVHSVVYSRDSAYLVSVGDAAVLISDAATGEPVGRIRLRGSGSMKPYDASSERIDLGAYHSPVVSGNGAYVAAFDTELRLAVWDARRGKALGGFEERGLRLRGFSEDGQFLLLEQREQGEIALSPLLVKLPELDVAAEVPLTDWRSRGGLGVFSDDGKWLAAATQERVEVLHVQSGREALAFVSGPSRIADMAFSPGGRWLAVAGGDDARTVRVFDVAEARPIARLFAHEQPVTGLAWSPGGRHLATSSLDGTVRVFDGSSLKLRRTIEVDGGRWRPVSDVTWSANGGQLAVGLADSPRVQVYQIDAVSLFNQRLFDDAAHDGWVTAVAFAADGNFALTGSRDRTLRLWDVDKQRVNRSIRGASSEVRQLAMSAGAIHAVDRAGNYMAFGLPDTKPLLGLPGDQDGRPPATQPAAISPDGGHAVFVVEDSIRVVDTANQQWVGQVTFLEMLQDGAQPARVAVANEALALAVLDRHGGSLQLWDLADGEAFFASPRQVEVAPVHAMTFSPDGRFVVLAGGRGVEVWHVLSGKLARRWSLQEAAAHGGAVLCAAFDPTSQRIAVGDAGGGITLLDTVSGKRAGSLPRQAGYVLSVAFDAAGQRLIAGYSDTTARIWRVGGRPPVRPVSQQPSQ